MRSCSISHCVIYTQQAVPEAVALTAGTAAEAVTQRAATGCLHLAPTHCAANPTRSDVSAITFAVGLLQGHTAWHSTAQHTASHGLQRPACKHPLLPPKMCKTAHSPSTMPCTDLHSYQQRVALLAAARLLAGQLILQLRYELQAVQRYHPGHTHNTAPTQQQGCLKQAQSMCVRSSCHAMHAGQLNVAAAATAASSLTCRHGHLPAAAAAAAAAAVAAAAARSSTSSQLCNASTAGSRLKGGVHPWWCRLCIQPSNDALSCGQQRGECLVTPTACPLFPQMRLCSHLWPGSLLGTAVNRSEAQPHCAEGSKGRSCSNQGRHVSPPGGDGAVVTQRQPYPTLPNTSTCFTRSSAGGGGH